LESIASQGTVAPALMSGDVSARWLSPAACIHKHWDDHEIRRARKRALGVAIIAPRVVYHER
jgi:hypothetical protein